MSDECSAWLRYARENLEVAEMTLEVGLLNPCLQNAQQAVEKAFKAIRCHRGLPAKRTHSIRDLNRELVTSGFRTEFSEEDCDLLDSIYVSSKYPVDSVLPDAEPDVLVCQQCVTLARRTVVMAEDTIGE